MPDDIIESGLLASAAAPRIEHSVPEASARASRSQAFLWRTLLVLVSCAALAYTCWFTSRVHISEPFGDFWLGWINQYQLWTSGHFTFHELIKPWNEHRIATARIVFLLDSIWFSMGGVFPTVVMLASMALSGALLGRWGQAGNALAGRCVLPVIFWVAWMASTSQGDNLQFPFQVQFGLLVLFAVLSAILLAHAARATPRRAALFGFLSSICFVLTAFSMGAGIMLAPMLVLLCIITRARWQAVLAWAPLSIAGLVLFLQEYPTPDRHKLFVPRLIPTRLLFIADFPMSCFKAFPFLAHLIGLASLLLLAYLSLQILRRTRKTGAPAPEAALIALAGFVILCGLSGALTDRVTLAPSPALESRYASLGLLYVASVSLLAMRAFRMPSASRTGQAFASIFGCAALAAVNLPAYLWESSAVAAQVKNNDDLIANNVGVEGPMTFFFGPPMPDVGHAASFLHEHSLSLFSPRLRPPANAVQAIASARSVPPCLGYVDRAFAIDDHAVLVDGWMALSRKRMVSWVVARENGVVIGGARPFEPRPDIGPALAPNTQALGFKDGFRLTDPPLPDGTPRQIELFGIAPGKKPNICMLPGSVSIGPVKVTPLGHLSQGQPLPNLAVQTGDALPATDVPFLPEAAATLPFWKVPSGQPGHFVFTIGAQSMQPGRDLILPFQGMIDAASRRVTFRFADGAAYSGDLIWPWEKPHSLGAVLPASIIAAHPGPIIAEAQIAPGPSIFIGTPFAGGVQADWSKMY